jgi:hypothetical protein
MRSASLSQEIKLLEPALFLRTELASNNDSRPKHSVLRGSLIVHVGKPTNIKSITLSLRGRCQIVWPDRDCTEDRMIHKQSQVLFGSGSLNVTVSSDPLITENSRIGTHYIVLPGEGNGLNLAELLEHTDSGSGSDSPTSSPNSSISSPRNKTSVNGMVVPVGIYEFPFELVVPNTIPESVECIYGKISYHLCAKIERPSVLHANLALNKQIPVLRLGPDEHNSLLHRIITVRSGQSKYLDCSAQIQGRLFALGTRIPMLVKITPFEALKVEFSQISILQQVSYRLLSQTDVKSEPVAEFGFKDSGSVSSKYDSKGKLLVTPTEIGFSVMVPNNNSGLGEILQPTCTAGPIRVMHWLKIVLEFSTKGKAAFDVIFEVPIRLLSPDCAKVNSVLPEYYTTIHSHDSALPSYDTISPSRGTIHPPDYAASSSSDMISSHEGTLLKI